MFNYVGYSQKQISAAFAANHRLLVLSIEYLVLQFQLNKQSIQHPKQRTDFLAVKKGPRPELRHQLTAKLEKELGVNTNDTPTELNDHIDQPSKNAWKLYA